MTDEKAEEKKEQAQEKAPKPEKASEKKAGKTEVPKAPPLKSEKPEGKKGKKISRMTLAEVEGKLKTVKEKMGGFQSAFAQHLLARKKELTDSASSLRGAP